VPVFVLTLLTEKENGELMQCRPKTIHAASFILIQEAETQFQFHLRALLGLIPYELPCEIWYFTKSSVVAERMRYTL